MGHRSVKDSLGHGKINPYKNMAFAAVRDVIREGALVAIDSNHKGEDSFYLSAPVLMNGKRNILTTLIHRDVNTQRMYVHSVILQENLLKPRVSEAQEGKTSRKHNSSLTSTDIHNILHQALTYKPLSDKLDSKPITEPSQAPKDEENKGHKTQKEKRDSVSQVGVSESSALNEGKKEQDGPSQNINYSESKRDNENNKPSRHQADEKTETTTSESKLPEEDFVIEDNDEVKGLKKQFNTNIKIIELLATLKQEERQATQEERNLLSQWTGWGGLSNAFYRPDGTVAEGWGNEAKQLKDILSDQEYKEALASILDAYYTPKMLIKTIWELLKGMGFEGGIVLEPSMGTGNFIGMAPKNNKTAFLGVELNPMSGAIARHLYPNAGIEITDFKDYLPPNHVDLVVGNPPFGSFKVYDPKIPEISGFSIHNYFMAKSLYSLKPNGVMAMVVSSHFMDSKSDATRKYMAKYGEFLGAVRLPNGVFKENANTDVLTDIVLFRKKTQEEIDARDNLESLREDFLETSRYGRHDSGVYINQYFKHRREKVLGELEIKPTSRFGTPILGVKANDDTE